MAISRKTARLVGATVAVLLVAVLAFYFLVLPRLINSQALKAHIRTFAKQELGAQVDFKRLSLHLLPRPHVTLTDLVLSIPPGISSTTAVARIAPEIFPLFSGKVRIASVWLKSNTLNMAVPDMSAGGKSPVGKFSIVEIRKRLEKIIAALPEMKIPRLKLGVIDSRAALRIGQRKVLEFTQINGDLSGAGAQREITFRCASSRWREVDVRASLNAETFKGNGIIRLSRLRLQELPCLQGPSQEGGHVLTESSDLAHLSLHLTQPHWNITHHLEI